MKKMIPYEKLSKKKQREYNARRRNTWGSLNPVTRKPANPKAYNRQKARKRNFDDFPPSLLFYAVLFLFPRHLLRNPQEINICERRGHKLGHPERMPHTDHTE